MKVKQKEEYIFAALELEKNISSETIKRFLDLQKKMIEQEFGISIAEQEKMSVEEHNKLIERLNALLMPKSDFLQNSSNAQDVAKK